MTLWFSLLIWPLLGIVFLRGVFLYPAIDTVMAYCTSQDVVDRLSSTGILYFVDDDSSGTVGVAETQLITDIIELAQSEVDCALAAWMEVPVTITATATERLTWLKLQTINIATAMVCQRKGASLPDEIKEAATRTRQQLVEVAEGTRKVPYLTYPLERNAQILRNVGLPIVRNGGR